MMTYTLLAKSENVRRDSDGALIPNDATNTDWAAYQGWLSAGNAPAAAVPLQRTALDAAIRVACDTAIVAGFSTNDVSRRASMNLWVSAVLAAQAGGATPSADDTNCLAMVPKMNAWEGSMFVERDRLIAAGLAASDAKWPALPDGGAAFVASCNQG